MTDTSTVLYGGSRAERRRRRRAGAVAAREAAARAELFGIREVIVAAGDTVRHGWLQHAWFAARDDAPAACLVGAIIDGGGGVRALWSQRTQRTLDLLWHTLYRADDAGPVRWCPAPALRKLQVRDLTSWNDHPRRTADDVLNLLEAAADRISRDLGRAPAYA